MTRNNYNVDDIYTSYYLNQAGTGFGSVYAGNAYQRGHGIGSFLGGLFRCVFPLLKSGTRTIGSELLKTGVNIVSDIAQNGDIDTAVKIRGKETLNNLSRIAGDKMFGRGYSTNVSRKRKQSQSNTRGGKKAKKTKPKNKKSKPAKKKQIKKKQPKNQKKRTVNKKPRSKQEIFDIFQ